MTARSLALVQAVGRLGLGGALLLAPGVTAGPWVGGVADTPGGQALARGFGARDLGLALGMLSAMRAGHGAGGWLRAGMIADAGDLVATLRARDSLPGLAVPAVVAMAGGSIALGAWLQTALD